MKSLQIFFTLFIFSVSFLFAQEQESDVDCLILEDENSIVCKYIHTRVDFDKQVLVEWIEPDGTVSRSREMKIPAMHGSIYDYRYIKGRTLGTWSFRVTDGANQYMTNFTLK
jgi:hypothetical protein